MDIFYKLEKVSEKLKKELNTNDLSLCITEKYEFLLNIYDGKYTCFLYFDFNGNIKDNHLITKHHDVISCFKKLFLEDEINQDYMFHSKVKNELRRKGYILPSLDIISELFNEQFYIFKNGYKLYVHIKEYVLTSGYKKLYDIDLIFYDFQDIENFEINHYSISKPSESNSEKSIYSLYYNHIKNIIINYKKDIYGKY